MINRRDLRIESSYKNWAVIFDKCDPKRQKDRCELMPDTKFQPCRRLVRNYLAERKIRSCRLASEQFLELKEKLGLDPNVYSFDEQDLKVHCKLHLREKLCILNTVFKTKDLIFTFLNTNFE